MKPGFIIANEPRPLNKPTQLKTALNTYSICGKWKEFGRQGAAHVHLHCKPIL